jgi:hypothetical protein
MMTMRAPTAADIQKDKDLKELHAMIPPDASVAIGESEMTHVSRLNIKGLRDTWDADYILYAFASGFGGGTNADHALASGQFDKVAERPGLGLLKRKSAPPLLTPPAPAKPPAPTAPAPAPAPAQAPAPTNQPAPPAPPTRPAGWRVETGTPAPPSAAPGNR